jgi:hypothetical protein
MKKLTANVPWIVAAAMLIALGSASSARAQETKLVAHVPFAFIVGNAGLPAGDYVVKDESNDNSVLGIASADGKRFVNTLTIPAAPENSMELSELVFDKVGNRYFLARVIAPGSEERDILVRPAATEREVAVNLSTR